MSFLKPTGPVDEYGPSAQTVLGLRRCLFVFLDVVLIASILYAQSGVLIPLPQEKPNAAVLSLAVMNVDIVIDNQHATVKVAQIFDNHTANSLEGKYIFGLPERASVSDFAVWDADQRIPGVMMEKHRANQIYGEIRAVHTDPGILQSTDDSEPNRGAGFSARIAPIDGYGTKRLEMEYSEELPVESLTSHFTFPLKPALGDVQSVGELNVSLHLLSDFPVRPLISDQAPYPLQVTKSEPNEFCGEYHGSNVELGNDLSFDYQISADQSGLRVITHRAPETTSAYDLRDPKQGPRDTDGFFEAQAMLEPTAVVATAPKRLVLLLDTSLSMYGDKLARSVEAIDFFLHSLTADDEFNLILFNEDTNSFADKPVVATPENIEQALQFVRSSYLAGGTNIQKGLERSVQQAKLFGDGQPAIVMISDVNPTLGTTQSKTITKVLDNSNARVFALALGTDANPELPRDLATKTNGAFEQVRETDDLGLELKLFFAKVAAGDISGLKLESSDATNLVDIYPDGESSFPGSMFSFVGRYRRPQQQTLTMTGSDSGSPISLSSDVAFPELDIEHDWLPRVWARARVDALLHLMDQDGEREDLIAEVIRLSEEYKFVTPYTAFLAAPRSLLRPRLIQPGDPVLRIKTDPSITEVFAVLPFGQTAQLKFIASDDVWETRFLAPAWMANGTYICRLLMTDKDGNGYQEEKTFVIDSKAPKIKISLDSRTVSAGDKIEVRAAADSDTSHLTARIYGAMPVELRWSNSEKTNVGYLVVPETLASGRYPITVSAEDFAHNQTTEEEVVEVIGK